MSPTPFVLAFFAGFYACLFVTKGDVLSGVLSAAGCTYILCIRDRLK